MLSIGCLKQATAPSSTATQDFGYPLVLEDYIPLPPSITAVNLCAVCQTPFASCCSKCKNIRYCTSTCQSLDWARQHKLVCKPYLAALTQRPCPSSRRVIYFPADSAKPVFAYLSFGEKGEVYGMENFFPDGETKKLSFHNRNVPYFIQLTYDTNPLGKRELPGNKSLGRPFRGPVVALAYDPEKGLSGPAEDVDTTILGPLGEFVRLMREYNGPVFIEVRKELAGVRSFGALTRRSNRRRGTARKR
jgi:hypothetical protein